MVSVELYSKPGCHLCDIMKGSLEQIRKRFPFEFREITIREGDQYFERFKDRIPVLFIDNEFAFQHRLPEDQFIEKLKSLSKP
jgi:glutaredoxin